MLDKLKALFIVQSDTSSNDDKEVSNLKTEKKKVVISENESIVNDKIMMELLYALDENNQKGFDYLEFKNAVKSLKSIEMDEKTRYVSAFTTAKTLGLTVPKLIDSIEFYLNILQVQKKKFNESLNKNISNLSLSQKREYSKTISLKKEQIKQLTKEILELEKEVNDVSSKGYSNYEFESTINVLFREMRDDIKKIKTHLQ